MTAEVAEPTETRRKDPLVPNFSFQHLPKGDLAHPVMKDIFALRYEVYCLECGYLSPEDYKDSSEKDDYDDRSTHVAGFGQDAKIIGTVRLVQAKDKQIFPFEEHCSVFDGYKFPPREESGEVSRLVVRKTHRRRRGDSMEGVSQEFRDSGNSEKIEREIAQGYRKERRSSTPQVVLGLYRQMYRYSRRAGIRYWYAAMEQSLAGSLAKMGFRFVPIGPETDYYGPVTPFIVDLEDLRTSLRQESPFLYAWFHDEHISLWLMFRTMVSMKVKSVFKKRQPVAQPA